MIQIEEIWKPVLDYEGLYEVSNQGNIKSLNSSSKKKGKLLTPVNRTKYLAVSLYKGSLKKSVNVHVIVAEAFLDFIVENDKSLIVDHKDNNPLNNWVTNLQIITHRKNLIKENRGITSKFPGVYWEKNKNIWTSCIRLNYIKFFLGYFDTEEEAYSIYQKTFKDIENGSFTKEQLLIDRKERRLRNKIKRNEKRQY